MISCVTLLCLEHRDDSPASPSTELINEVIETLPVKETTVDIDHGMQTFMELRKLVQELNRKLKTQFPSTSEVMQMIQISCREEVFLYEAARDAINEDFPDGQSIMRRVNSYRSTLHTYMNEERIKALVKDCSAKLLFNRGGAVDPAALVNDMVEKVAPYLKARSEMRHPAEIGSMDFSNPTGVADYFESVKNTLSSEGAFKTGWKGFNRMLGKLGAMRRGEFILGGGLQHNFKTGLSLALFCHVCLFNKPFMRDKNKKPMVLFVTLENEIPDNLLIIYAYIKENETGEKVDVGLINKQEAADYVCARMEETGFTVKMVRFDPSDFSIGGFTNYLDGIQAQGFEIQYLCVDYLNMLPKTGLDAQVAGDDIRLLFRRMRNYTTPRGITFFSPHQLSSDALQLSRENTEDLVKVVANRGYYDGCRRLGQEPDLEILFHIVKMGGKSYFTVQRGKHRNTVTRAEDQYFVLPFQDIGTIPWDIDKDEDYTLSAVGRKQGADGDEFDDSWA
jgi:hypothetical protein